MGISLSTARWLAPASFIYDFLAQQYGMFSTPSMKDVHDRNLSFWSPQPYFIAGFFAPQQLFQLAWLYKLYRANSLGAQASPTEKRAIDQAVRFAPYYALGNICIGTWMFFWNAEKLGLANVFVTINSFTQLWFCLTQLEKMDTSSTTDVLTHVVAKTFAGIGVLDFLHNTSVAYFKNASPSPAIKALTAIGFGGLALSSDWILGASLVYDLVALSVGQAGYGEPGWSKMLAGFGVGTAALVGLRNYYIPPYVKSDDYALTQGEEGVGDV